MDAMDAMDDRHDTGLKLFPEELPDEGYPRGTRAYWFQHPKAVYNLHVTHVLRDSDGNAKFINESPDFTRGTFRPLKDDEAPQVSHIVVLPGGVVDPSFLD